MDFNGAKLMVAAEDVAINFHSIVTVNSFTS